MLAAIGLSEADVHITNIVYWRPPGNRTPTPQEAQACRPFLERQVELVAPEVVRRSAARRRNICSTCADGIMRIRGKWRELDDRRPRSRPGHAASRVPLAHAGRQGLAWRDLLAVKAALAS